MFRLHVCSLVILVVASSACSTITSPTPGTPSAAQTAALLEGTWTLVSLQPSGQPQQDRPAGATYTATFTDGRLSTRVDCNMCIGGFSIAGSMINVATNLACTRAACPTLQFESLYESILSGESSIAVSGPSLTLTSTRGTLRFVQ